MFIYGKQLVLDAIQNQRVQPRAEIHLATEDGREFLAIAEAIKTDPFQNARLKLRQHITSLRCGSKSSCTTEPNKLNLRMPRSRQKRAIRSRSIWMGSSATLTEK